MLHSHISHHKRSSSSSHLHVKRGIPASNNASLIIVAILLTVAVILFILILVIMILKQRRRSRNRISNSKLKPLQLVVTNEICHLKNNDPLKRASQYQMNKPLNVPVELAKPAKEYYNSDAKPLILTSTDLKVESKEMVIILTSDINGLVWSDLKPKPNQTD
ncbi:13214_t:CDS:2 [Rhizophagus irregularis]|nr:13214_t:CDS:2 [Rhizophagus irregularis]